MLRLAAVTPRFWPLIDDRALHLLRLSEALAEQGCEVTIVTPRWTRAWPERMALGKVAVVRLAGSAGGGFGTLRWMYSLGRWLRQQHSLVVLVDGLKREAQLVLAAAKDWPDAPILLASESELSSLLVANKRRATAKLGRAGAIVAPTEELAECVRAAGYDFGHLSVIPRAAIVLEPRSPESRAAARLALAAVNYDLATTPNSVVALAVGRLDEFHAFGDLLRAWRIVTARRPEAKLWIVGDGPHRQRLYQQIGDLDQRFRVMLPGMFERLDDLLHACDLLLVPAPHAVPPLALLDAAAAGVPIIAANGPAARQLVASPETGRLYSTGDFKALAEAVFDTIEHLNDGRRPPQAPPVRTPLEEAAEYVALIKRLQSKA